MTTTYDPFLPADGADHHRSDAGRRAVGRADAPGRGGAGTRRADGSTGWAPPEPRRPESYREPEHYREPESYREPEPYRVAEPRWEPQPHGEPEPYRVAEPRWEPQPHGEPGPHRGPGPQRAAEPYREAPPQQHWHPEPASPPRWQTGAEAGSPARPELVPDPGPRRRGRAKPLLAVLVTVLSGVAGWQAYRIEQMHSDNAAMHTVLTAERDRTDRLERQLAGVFDPEAVSSKVLPSVFRVRAGDFTGTAFSVGAQARRGEANLFTNYHVVAEVWTDGGRTVSLERGETKIKATIVKVSKGKDLALLHADEEIAGLSTAATQVKPGQPVVVVGAPLGLDDTVTTGVISAWRPKDPDGPTIQFDAPINPGNSGGPVVNSVNQVVGLATAKAKDAEGIGLAIPIRTACETFDVC
jgi:putative serine protease PepD